MAIESLVDKDRPSCLHLVKDSAMDWLCHPDSVAAVVVDRTLPSEDWDKGIDSRLALVDACSHKVVAFP